MSLPLRPGVPPPSKELGDELAVRKAKLLAVTATRRAEASERIRQRIGKYLLAQRELEKYPDTAFNQVLSKDDLIPATVHDWETFLDRARNSSDPIFVPWFAFAELSDSDFSDKAGEVTERLKSSSNAINRRVAQAFVQPPATRAEVAQRYQQVFAKIDEEWMHLSAAAQRDERPALASLPDTDDEALRQMLDAPHSPCVIPDTTIVDNENYFNLDTTAELWKLQSDVDQSLKQNPVSTPHALVLTDREQPVEPRVFRRGNPTTLGDTVPRRFLKLLSGPERRPFATGSGRLELAQAIVDPRNPLTARVWVNRVWLYHFGTPLVSTPSDFGLCAEPPSHPRLLDWLADEFVASGWNTKSLHRQIMLSATYQQPASLPTDATPASQERARQAQERDPGNRLLWRMKPRRLSFEQFRDTLIALSGEVDSTRGGTAVDLFSAGPKGFRRSIYAQVDRQFLPGVLRSFDFANPDLHSAARPETSVPQQALFALNHRFVADRARAIARQLAISPDVPTADGVTRLYQRVLQRDPTAAELRRAMAFVEPANQSPGAAAPMPNSDWAYGYGEIDPQTGGLKSFVLLPHFSGSSWQGGSNWPDATLGWVQLTAAGGHPGNDLQHAAVRRWKAPIAGVLAVTSEFVHEPQVGDGVRYWVLSSRHGLLKSGTIFGAESGERRGRSAGRRHDRFRRRYQCQSEL